MTSKEVTRRGFFTAVAVAAAAATLEGLLPAVSGAPQGRLFRGAHAVTKDAQTEQLVRGIKILTPEDRRLAAELRPIAVDVVSGLVADRAQRWEKKQSVDPNLQTTTTTLVATTKLSNGDILTVELSSQRWPAGPPETTLTVKASGTERFLTIRGGAQMEGVRDTQRERAAVDSLYKAASARVQ